MTTLSQGRESIGTSTIISRNILSNMSNYMKTPFIALTALLFSTAVFAQPRPAEQSTSAPSVQAAPRNVPSTMSAKYEGGMFGDDKEEGTLKMDDDNKRLVFYGKNGKEFLAIPYDAFSVVSAQSRTVRSTTGTVISVIPLPGASLAGLMRGKRRYLVLQFDDPDINVRGVVNFKLANKQVLADVVDALGQKAKLTKRGDSYYRPRTPRGEI